MKDESNKSNHGHTGARTRRRIAANQLSHCLAKRAMLAAMAPSIFDRRLLEHER
jgi:hypothetical protein